MKYKEEGKKEMSVNLFSLLPETFDTQHAKEASQLQSQVLSTVTYILWGPIPQGHSLLIPLSIHPIVNAISQELLDGISSHVAQALTGTKGLTDLIWVVKGQGHVDLDYVWKET